MMTSFTVFGVASIVCLTLASGGNLRSFGRDNDATFRCPSEGFHPDPDDCRIFYRCVDWNSNVFFRDYGEPSLTPFRFTCGEGTVFDPAYNICNHPDHTSRKECAGRGTGGDNGEYPFIYPSSVAPGSGYPGYPTQEGNTNYPGAYPNEYENQVSPEGEMMELSPGECSGEGFFPVPGDCNRFMRCTEDGKGGYKKFVFRCGEGTVWDKENLVCNHPASVPECGGSQSGQNPQEGGYPEDGNPLGYPQENRPDHSGHPQESYPNQGGYTDPSGYPDTQGNQGGHPSTDIRPPGGNQGYPEYPGQGYPAHGNRPQGQNQGSRPSTNLQNRPDELGYPQEGGYPNQQNQGSYPAPGNESPQGNRPPINRPEYPQQGEYPNQQNQGSHPSYGNQPQSPGYPQLGSRPSGSEQNQGSGQNQMGFPPQQGYPGQQNQGYYPTPGYQSPEQNQGHPQQQQVGGPPTYQQNQGNSPNQFGSYPGQQNPGHSEYPQQSGYPPYPQQGQPDQGSSPTGSQNGCQRDGFFSESGDCTKFYRCVDNGKAGFMRYDFACGPGTVWDQEQTTCNHPWAVQRNDCLNSDPSGSHTSGGSDPDKQQFGFSQTPPQITPPTNPSSTQSTNQKSPQTTPATNQGQMTTQPTPPQQTPFNQMSMQTTTTEQTTQSPESETTQMKTTEGFHGESTTANNQPEAPPGSRPCQPVKNQPVKCETAGFYPVPGNCKKFYRCVDWDGDKRERFSVYFFECGEGTIWDPSLQTCNHEESVYPPRDCSGGQDNQTISTAQKTTESTVSTTPDESNTTPVEESTSSGPAESTQQSTEGMTTSETTTERQETTPEQTDKSTEPDSNSATEPSSPTEPGSSIPTEPGTDNPTEPGETSPTEPTTDEDNNRPGGSNPDCPALEEGQVHFVCPTGFRRHPKDCNLFYQCTISKEGDVNVMTFTCKNDSIYDERKIQCLPPEETTPCPNEQSRRRYTRRVEQEMTSVVPIASSESLCPKEGHFPYDGDCQMFFRCKKDHRGRMQGYLYRCQSKRTFSPASGRCERSSTMQKCGKSAQYLTPANLKWMTSKVPIEYFDVR